MKFYSFSNSNNPVIILLSGTCCHWRNSFDEVIPLLKDDFYVVYQYLVQNKQTSDRP